MLAGLVHSVMLFAMWIMMLGNCSSRDPATAVHWLAVSKCDACQIQSWISRISRDVCGIAHQTGVTGMQLTYICACRSIHKRLIDLHSPADVVKQITSIR